MTESSQRKVRGAVLVRAATAFLAAATLAGFLAPFWWFCDLLVHFRVHYAFALVAACTLLAALRRPWFALAALGCALANFAIVAPPWFAAPTRDGAAAGELGASNTALLVNLRTGNRSTELVAAAIATYDPDVLVLLEADQRWLRELAPAVAGYPHREVVPRGDNFGIAFYTRLPVHSLRTISPGTAGLPTIVARVDLGATPVSIFATHPLPPMGAVRSALRNEQLAELAEIVARERTPVLVLGDLNTTPHSPFFRRFARDAGLVDSATTHQPTWPADLGALGIALDHCLHSSTLCVLERSTGPPTGSDHLPLFVRFGLVAAP